jgi:HSP20 family protein
MVEKTSLSSLWPSLYEPFRLAGSRIADWLSPASEASQDDNGYRISVELPGVAEEDIHLTVEDGMVEVKGEKKTSREEKGETWYFSERQFGSFTRSFRLPADADQAGVRAEVKNGVLTVVIPKKQQSEPTPKRIPIAKA